MVQSPTPQRKTLPTKFGSYFVNAKIGSGSFGNVYSCTHETTGERVALKVINSKKSSSPCIKSEIAIGQQLFDDSHVVTVRHSFTDGDNLCLVMELIEGGDLFEKFLANSTKGVSEAELRKLFREIVKAVDFAHQNKVVHRDIKPENVLIDFAGEVKLIDFGMGAVVEDDSLLNTFVGSLEYCSPEIISGHAYNGFKADCWSLGVLLYVLATGLFPWAGRTKEETMVYITRGKYVTIPDASVGLMDLISHLLCTNPNNRYDTTQILNHSFLSN